MTLKELAVHDGREGRRAYVAVNGTIYDVTDSPLWRNGEHPPDHRAGHDLTAELAGAPHVRAVVERFPVVGSLEAEPPAPAGGGKGKVTVGVIIAAIILAVVIFLAL